MRNCGCADNLPNFGGASQNNSIKVVGNLSRVVNRKLIPFFLPLYKRFPVKMFRMDFHVVLPEHLSQSSRSARLGSQYHYELSQLFHKPK